MGFCRLACTGEEEVKAAVFVGVHLYRVAPSLYSPILGLIWRYCRHILWPTSSTQWMGGRVPVSVCVRVLFSAPIFGGSQLLISLGPNDNPNSPLFTPPHVPTPVLPIPSNICHVQLTYNLSHYHWPTIRFEHFLTDQLYLQLLHVLKLFQGLERASQIFVFPSFMALIRKKSCWYILHKLCLCFFCHRHYLCLRCSVLLSVFRRYIFKN